jgi:tRNA (cytidine/uridine-2'-O-)-methyltransferase
LEVAVIVRSEPDFSLEAAGDSLCHVVLVTPEIPQNTGSVARMAAGARAWLHLVEPLGFALEDRYLKRAGLDYWPGVRLSVHPSVSALAAMLPRDRTVLFSAKATELYTDRTYERGAVLVFGCETRGLPAELVDAFSDTLVRIPTSGEIRSLNLATSVGIATFEVVRQQGWRGEAPLTGPRE